jgi:hypothetical protein
MLYPLSYEGGEGQGSAPAHGGRTEVGSVAGLLAHMEATTIMPPRIWALGPVPRPCGGESRRPN